MAEAAGEATAGVAEDVVRDGRIKFRDVLRTKKSTYGWDRCPVASRCTCPVRGIKARR